MAEEVSKFDRELSDYASGKLPKNHIFSLGTPGEILEKCGFPKNQRIELAASRLEFKSKLDWHPFDIDDVYGLDKALQKPVAVFSYGDRKKSQNVVVNIEKDGKNFLAGIHFNQKSRGYEVSDMRTLFPKDTIDWLNWINQGKMIYGNKEKLQALIAQQRINVAEVSGQVVQSPLHEHCLESASSILQKFGGVNDIFTDGHEFYSELKEKSDIEQKFYAFYTENGNLDARELAQYEAEEFYHALKTGDSEKIREYTESDLHETAELAREISDSRVARTQGLPNGNHAHNPLTDYTVLDVDGTSVECKTGLISGMKNAVSDVIRLEGEVERLTTENEQLRNQNKNHRQNNNRSGGWER